MEEEQKKKRGRPLKNDARRKRIFSHCNEDEYELIERAANIKGVSVAELIRNSVYEASKDVVTKREKALKDLYGNGNESNFDEF